MDADTTPEIVLVREVWSETLTTCPTCGAVEGERCPRICPARRERESFDAEVRELTAQLERHGCPHYEASQIAKRALRTSLARQAADRLLGRGEPEAVGEPILLTLAEGT